MQTLPKFLSLACIATLATACGGGTRVTEGPGTTSNVTVTVFAGSPVSGSRVEAWVLDSTTGLPLETRFQRGLAAQGTSDTSGRCVLAVPTGASGLVLQFRAYGGTYQRPFVAEPASLPADVPLTSMLAEYNPTTSTTVTISIWTTLADVAAVAYATGKNPESPTSQSLRSGLAVVDPLFVSHVDGLGTTWSLRTTVPIAPDYAEKLDPAVVAGLGDVALDRLAASHSQPPTSLVAALVQDLAGDGQFNGKAAGTGLTFGPVALSAETTRGDLANAMDRAVRARTAGVCRANLKAAGVYDAMALDASLLYPKGEPPPAFHLKDDLTQVDVVVSVGAQPVAEASVAVYQVDAAGVPGAEPLGSQTTNAAGQATISLNKGASGLIQVVVASGGSFRNPLAASAKISLDGQALSTTLKAEDVTPGVPLPMTLWTTLADAAARAYAEGRNPTAPGRHTLEESLSLVDAWLAPRVAPGQSLRHVAPGSLTLPLSPTVNASLADLSLLSMAAVLSQQGGHTYSALHLLADLVTDLRADGQFNGRGDLAAAIATAGSPGYRFGTESTRGELARHLDHYILGSANASPLRREHLSTVYAAIALDTCPLYPSASIPPAFDLDSTVPVIVQVQAPRWTASATTATVTVTARDLSGRGLDAVFASVGGAPALRGTIKETTADGTLAEFTVRLASGPNEIAFWAEDKNGASGEAAISQPWKHTIVITNDTTPPTVEIVAFPSYRDEAGLSLEDDTVPPKYKYASGTFLSVVPGTPITKSFARLSWGPAKPLAPELEHGNATNTPTLKIQVKEPAGDSPSSVTCSFEIEDGYPEPAQLIETTRTTQGRTFLAPICLETLFGGEPPRTTATQFRVTCEAKDEAGNKATLPQTALYTFIVGPVPVYVREDESYRFAPDPQGIGSVSFEAGTYRHLWNGADRRLKRWIVSNPTPVPLEVTVTEDCPQSATITETVWTGSRRADVTGPAMPGPRWDYDLDPKPVFESRYYWTACERLCDDSRCYPDCLQGDAAFGFHCSWKCAQGSTGYCPAWENGCVIPVIGAAGQCVPPMDPKCQTCCYPGCVATVSASQKINGKIANGYSVQGPIVDGEPTREKCTSDRILVMNSSAWTAQPNPAFENFTCVAPATLPDSTVNQTSAGPADPISLATVDSRDETKTTKQVPAAVSGVAGQLVIYATLEPRSREGLSELGEWRTPDQNWPQSLFVHKAGDLIHQKEEIWKVTSSSACTTYPPQTDNDVPKGVRIPEIKEWTRHRRMEILSGAKLSFSGGWRLSTKAAAGPAASEVAHTCFSDTTQF